MPSLSDLSGTIKLVMLGVLFAAIASLVLIIAGWRGDSMALATLKPTHEKVVAERDRYRQDVLDLTAESRTQQGVIADLKAAIAEQNHSLDLAEARAKAAEQLQAHAKAQAEKKARQSERRIAELERDLADLSKTVSDLLDASWRQHHDE